MRPFARMLRTDVRYGLRAVGPRLLVMVVFVAFALFMSVIGIYSFRDGVDDSKAVCLGDALLCVMGGMERFVPADGNQFKFPMAWTAMLVTMAYVALDYPVRDLDGMGTHLIVAAGGRAQWWLAKCAWCVLCALLCSAAVALACALTVALTGGAWDWTPTYEGFFATGLAGVGSRAAPASLLPFFLTVPLALSAVLLAQLAATLLAGPYAGLALTVGGLFFSAYYVCPFLPAEYLMAARCDALLTTGVSPAAGALLAGAVCLASVALGGALLGRRDIAGRKDGA